VIGVMVIEVIVRFFQFLHNPKEARNSLSFQHLILALEPDNRQQDVPGPAVHFNLRNYLSSGGSSWNRISHFAITHLCWA